MWRIAVRGAVAGAAILGGLIASLGGASWSLLAVMWALGTLAVLVQEVRRGGRGGSWPWV